MSAFSRPKRAFPGRAIFNDGGSVLVSDCDGNPCRIYWKDAGTNGGGVYNLEGSFQMSGGDLTNNVAATNGGGIANDAGTVNCSDVAFSGNTANNGGGALYLTAGSNTTLDGGSVYDNLATFGPGVYYSLQATSFDVSTCEFGADQFKASF